MFNCRRMLRGSRPRLLRCLVIERLPRPSPSTPTHDRDGSQPSPFRPTGRNICGRPAPTQIEIGCAAAGTRFTPLTR